MQEPQKWFETTLRAFQDDREFRLETIILDITERICKRMKEKGISRVELANRLNVSPAAVTKILNGNSNFTLRTLLALTDALGLELKVDFREKTPGVRVTITSDEPFLGRELIPPAANTTYEWGRTVPGSTSDET